MENNDTKQWKKNVGLEIQKISIIIRNLGFSLDQNQPHTNGERFLMTKDKLVLVGKRASDDLRVIIKASNHKGGEQEIGSEKRARDLLQTLSFTQENILFPREIFFGNQNDYLFWIIEFIEQKKVFVEHSVEEQFFLILRAFESQEAFHATTFEHIRQVTSVFPVFYVQEYLKEFQNFKATISTNYLDEEIKRTLEVASNILHKHKKEIDMFCGYLIHTDFVPHNFRVKDNDVYMLDCSAILFGNKYEGWARFLNYMIIHNPSLEQILIKYIKDNRDVADYTNLRMMRIYKIGFLLQYYTIALGKTSGDLRKLTEERINFWHENLKAILRDKQIDQKIISDYKKERDILRSEEEKKRQKEFAVA